MIRSIPAMEPFEAEFATAIQAWRETHRLQEDDAIFLLLELFRIHQAHWDALRRRQPPGYEDLQALIKDVASRLETRLEHSTGPTRPLASLPSAVSGRVHRSAAILALLASALGGFILGRSGL